MRGHVAARPGFSSLVLVLAVVLVSAVGAILTCQDAVAAPGAGAVARVAAGPMPGPTPGPTPLDPCTSEQPCQHGPRPATATADAAVRASTPGEPTVPAALPVCRTRHRGGPAPRVASASAAVPPPAVRAPVAVLCVDRN